jgi:hypothetical protein
MSNPRSDCSSASAENLLAATIENSLAELKTRARLRLNALNASEPAVTAYAKRISKKHRWPWPAEWKLRHTFNIAATEIGFRDWAHARRVLGGQSIPGDDMGGFWYDFRCDLLLNQWFARYEEARDYRQQSNDRWLFPYGKQFVVGDANYVRALALDPGLPLWTSVSRDLVACYGNAAWSELCSAKLATTRGLPPPISGRY